AGIAAPREDEFARAPAADHLVVEQIGRHADERQLADALADDLVTSRKRNEMREPFEGHGRALAHEGGDGVREAHHLHGRRSLSCWSRRVNRLSTIMGDYRMTPWLKYGGAPRRAKRSTRPSRRQ